MLRAQSAMGGGVLNGVVEHVGDLTHRMTEMVRHGNLGYENVEPKVRRTLRALTSGYGFVREHEENMRSNAKSRGISLEEHTGRVDRALALYADEHAKLPVFNDAQLHAREAAVSLGHGLWAEAATHLSILASHLGSGADWIRYASQFAPAYGQLAVTAIKIAKDDG